MSRKRSPRVVPRTVSPKPPERHASAAPFASWRVAGPQAACADGVWRSAGTSGDTNDVIVISPARTTLHPPRAQRRVPNGQREQLSLEVYPRRQRPRHGRTGTGPPARARRRRQRPLTARRRGRVVRDAARPPLRSAERPLEAARRRRGPGARSTPRCRLERRRVLAAARTRSSTAAAATTAQRRRDDDDLSGFHGATASPGAAHAPSAALQGRVFRQRTSTPRPAAPRPASPRVTRRRPREDTSTSPTPRTTPPLAGLSDLAVKHGVASSAVRVGLRVGRDCGLISARAEGSGAAAAAPMAPSLRPHARTTVGHPAAHRGARNPGDRRHHTRRTALTKPTRRDRPRHLHRPGRRAVTPPRPPTQ